jgi:hypothetical protein
VHLDFGTLLFVRGERTLTHPHRQVILSENSSQWAQRRSRRGVVAVDRPSDSRGGEPGIISRVREDDLKLDRRVSVAPMMDWSD